MESHEGASANGTSARGSPNIGLKDTTCGELSGPEGSMCPPSSPSWVTAIPDGCDDVAAVGDDQVGTSQPYPRLTFCSGALACGLSAEAVPNPADESFFYIFTVEGRPWC